MHKVAASMEVSTLLHRRHDAYGSVCIFLHPFLPHIDTLRFPLSVSVLYSKGRMGTWTIQANVAALPCTAFAKSMDCVLWLWRHSALGNRNLLLRALLTQTFHSSLLFCRMDLREHPIYYSPSFLVPPHGSTFCITTEITRSTEIRITSHQLYIQYTSYGGIKYSTDQNMIRNFLLAFYVTEWAAFDWSSKQSDTCQTGDLIWGKSLVSLLK